MTVPEAGALGASDGEQLRRARDEGRVIFTQDDDFLRLAAADTSHPGVVYATQERPIGEIVRGLMLIHEVLDAQELPTGLRPAWSREQRRVVSQEMAGRVEFCEASESTAEASLPAAEDYRAS